MNKEMNKNMGKNGLPTPKGPNFGGFIMEHYNWLRTTVIAIFLLYVDKIAIVQDFGDYRYMVLAGACALTYAGGLVSGRILAKETLEIKQLYFKTGTGDGERYWFLLKKGDKWEHCEFTAKPGSVLKKVEGDRKLTPVTGHEIASAFRSNANLDGGDI